MLRIGLTGDLGSGKSTVARMLAERGAIVFSSDDMARSMMQPGQPVYDSIVASFGRDVLAPDNSLDRRKLAQLAFDPTHPRVDELNAIIHPAVIQEQARKIAALARTQPSAIVVVESALIFTASAAGEPWRDRFDRILLVTAPEDRKIARYLDRIAADRTLSAQERLDLETDARCRLDLQRITPDQAAACVVLQNDGSLVNLEQQVDSIWQALRCLAV